MQQAHTDDISHSARYVDDIPSSCSMSDVRGGADESDEGGIDDRVVADKGEGLDDDIYALEAYGIL